MSELLPDLPTAGSSAKSGRAYWWQVLQHTEKIKESE